MVGCRGWANEFTGPALFIEDWEIGGTKLFAPELATGNGQLATHYLDAGSSLLVLKIFALNWGKPLFN